MTTLRKILCICVMAAVLVMTFPVSSLAVDPVSAATMANAFAQAITAYGASQGVSMTFDVANTEGIGEGVHELWDQYASDMEQSNVTVSDYTNLAASVFPTLWKKTFDYVTVSLDAAAVGEIDGFWNWLLSGPAEMTKVDNQYYEWSIDQQTGTVLPINVYYDNYASINGYPVYTLPHTVQFNTFYTNFDVTQGSAYFITYSNESGRYSTVFFNPTSSFTCEFQKYNNSNNSPIGNLETYTSSSSYGYQALITDWGIIQSGQDAPLYIGQYSSPRLSDIFGTTGANASVDSGTNDISVQPYVGDAVPQNVYIPDNTDVNYNPVAQEIPLDILWDDALYGDGTGILTDAQSEAITQAADLAISDNLAKTLELADTDSPSNPSPNEVYIPLLPVNLPSFNFSLSGIWHYVVSWVQSLGSWMSLMFQTWAVLPSAITIPVYATAVIVIVLGVYKRFFM